MFRQRSETRQRPYPTRDRQLRFRLARQVQTSTLKTPYGIINAIISPRAGCRFLTKYLREFGTPVVVLMSHLRPRRELFHAGNARRLSLDPSDPGRRSPRARLDRQEDTVLHLSPCNVGEP